jgi:abortive infection bacteriophage resistance protein
MEAHTVGFSLPKIATAPRVQFAKRALTIDVQARRLAERRLVFGNWAEAHEHLEHIGYYRFTGYLRPFRIGGAGADAEDFRAGTTFELVHDRYIFDRRLRLLALDAIEKIEIALRASISNSVAVRHGPHWFMDIRNFAKQNWYHARGFDLNEWHAEFIESVKKEIGHEQETRRHPFIKHYYDKYNDPELPPCWMVFEAMSFGSVSMCFKFLKHPEFQDTCKKFGLNHQVLSSWMHAISHCRNICAHHSRLWNRIFTIKPIIPIARKAEFNGGNDRLYAILLVLQIVLSKIWSTNHWAEDLRDLIAKHPDVPLADMGFPADWSQRPVWRL